MIRLLLRLLGIKDFEVCASCETLKQQLDYERADKKQLTETLLSIVSPKAIETPVVEYNPIKVSAGTFARRREAAEAKDREEAKILRQSNNIGKPDNILKLETELGVEEETAS